MLQSEQFLGTSGKRTLFDITARSLVSIKEFSSLPEAELILLPGTILEVVSIYNAGGGLVIIQMKEKEPFTAMMDFIHPELKPSSVPKPLPPKPTAPKAIPVASAAAAAPVATIPVPPSVDLGFTRKTLTDHTNTVRFVGSR